jgi:hypothetical protein
MRTALLILAGAALITVGAYLIYVPAGFIVGGIALFVIEALTGPEPGQVVRR